MKPSKPPRSPHGGQSPGASSPGGPWTPGGGSPPRRPRPNVERPAVQTGSAGQHAGSGGRLRGTPEKVILWGFHAVLEALRSPRRKVLRVVATAAAAERVAPELAERDLQPEIMLPDAMDALLPREAVHQGIAIEARPLEPLDIADLPETGTLLVLDQITDPHNVGAILRTAAAFGVTGVVTTERHAPDMTGVLAKAASGGLEHVPIVGVVNLARALETLTKAGFQVIGLDSEGDTALEAVRPGASVALVLGAEGKGLRRLTRERCEIVARLDMPGAIKSLNVSNACAVALTMLRLRA